MKKKWFHILVEAFNMNTKQAEERNLVVEIKGMFFV